MCVCVCICVCMCVLSHVLRVACVALSHLAARCCPHHHRPRAAAAARAQGLLLPLCVSRSCTLREAVIFSSVLTRSSLPVLHSAAALLRLAQLEYAGTTSFFIRVLLDKKYALPYKVSRKQVVLVPRCVAALITPHTSLLRATASTARAHVCVLR